MVYPNKAPVMQMGASESNVSPWTWEVFGTPGVVNTMQQQIALGAEPELAWKDAVGHGINGRGMEIRLSRMETVGARLNGRVRFERSVTPEIDFGQNDTIK